MDKPKAINLNKNAGPPEMDHSYFSPLQIEVYDGNFEKAFRNFRALVQLERVLSAYKEKQSYEKPSEKRRRKHNESLQKAFELEVKKKKIKSGEYEKEKLKRQAKKNNRLKDRDNSFE